MLIKELHDFLIEKKKTLSLAESLTGGALSYKFVRMSGCSLYFKGSIVAYSAEAKKEILGVNSEVIKCYGEVSVESAQQMADGALSLFHSDYAIAVTGIAGPTGATAFKPIGLVALAVASLAGPTLTKIHNFQGDRGEIVEQTIASALLLFSKVIND